jgi:putative ABC transport system ATP-binding protein
MTVILRIEKLSKQYHHRDGIVNALDNISLSVEKGSFIAITGPSGSGKTTLLLALSGLIRPTSGEIYYNDEKLDLKSDKTLVNFRKKHVGFVMQNFSLIPYMTAVQNVMIPLVLEGISGSDQKIRAAEAMKSVGLGDRLNHYPRELSAGQQQRVAIARALVNEPAVIFADEPTGNMDPSLSIEILDLLQKINREKGLTVLMVTHSPVANEYGNIRIKLDEGKIISSKSQV